MFKKIWDWLVLSSVDPAKTSLTVKAGLTTLASIAINLSPILHLNLGNEQLTTVVDSFTQIVFYGLTAISSCVTVFAIGRKIINTFK